MVTYTKILDEINSLGKFYGMDTQKFISTLSPSSIANYVELVLDETSFSVVIGGVNQEAMLLEMAQTHGFNPEIINAFTACTNYFPSRMLYSKFPIQKRKDEPGAMYVLVLEPWENVCNFLRSLPVQKQAIESLLKINANNPLCFILAFSISSEIENTLNVKAYYLADRKSVDQSPKPFLNVHHLTVEGLKANKKSYTARVTLDSFADRNLHWKALTEFIQSPSLEYQNYALLKGESVSRELKLYVFRFDSRENEYYNLRTYNYYVEQGLKLIQLQEFDKALSAYENAVDYDPNDADAINGLGFCYMYTKQYIEGIQLVLKAKELNPKISNLVWSWALPVENLESKLESLTEQIAQHPNADLFHQRGIYYFQKKAYEEAKVDLLQAVSLDPHNAEIYNNLGGTYLKLGEFLEAIKSCNIALAFNRQITTSNLSIAREVLRLIRETEQNPSEISFNNLGKFFYQLDLFEEAKTSFSKGAIINLVNLKNEQKNSTLTV